MVWQRIGTRSFAPIKARATKLGCLLVSYWTLAAKIAKSKKRQCNMSRFDRGPAAAAEATPRPRLDVYDGDKLIETIRLTEGSHCLGRDTDACDLPLEHASCSRRHARLAVDARGGVLLEDLGSAQGTFLDGASTPLAALERVRLKEGASVKFASDPRRYVYRSGAAPASATAPAPAPAAAPLDADAKRKKLWGAPKKDALEKWGEAAGSLGGARGDKSVSYTHLTLPTKA